jgi:hypothetical protein
LLVADCVENHSHEVGFHADATPSEPPATLCDAANPPAPTTPLGCRPCPATMCSAAWAVGAWEWFTRPGNGGSIASLPSR